MASAEAAHIRFGTPNGPVHVWTPAGYDKESAGVVVYVHGFYTTLDNAWRRHRLPAQFAKSSINSLFIACEAPKGPRDEVNWTSLGALLEAVAQRVEVPAGHVVVVGHSGAHRTISMWLREDIAKTFVFVDAMFGDSAELLAWLDASPEHRLIDVAADTRPWTDALHAELPDTLVFERFPPASVGMLGGAREARVVYVRSQHDHMRLVTGGVALPMLLRALRLPIVEDASRSAPIHAL